MSSDPLSFFAGEDSSSSESEEEGKGKDKGPCSEGFSASSSDASKLPSPDTLFASVKKPSFLTSKTHINWDRFVKKDEPNVHLSEGGENYAAIAPPRDLGEQDRKVHTSLSAAIVRTYSNTGGEISAPPIRYSTNDMETKFKTVSDSAESASGGGAESGKRVRSDPVGGGEGGEGEEEGGGDTKKQKMENFRQKEKRKRNLGQTSRGKNYVEEEKRILRQQFATDEVMN